MALRISPVGYQELVISEGKKNKAYKCPRGFWTIGIGHRILNNEQYLLTKTLTDEEIKAIFDKDIATRENWINTHCAHWNPEIRQCEFDALCNFLFQYNIDKYPGTKYAFVLGHRPEIISQMKEFRNSKAGNNDNMMMPRRLREINMFKGIVNGS